MPLNRRPAIFKREPTTQEIVAGLHRIALHFNEWDMEQPQYICTAAAKLIEDLQRRAAQALTDNKQ